MQIGVLHDGKWIATLDRHFLFLWQSPSTNLVAGWDTFSLLSFLFHLSFSNSIEGQTSITQDLKIFTCVETLVTKRHIHWNDCGFTS
jgi:hypothetical protein